eukprot:gene2562-5410_t
MAGQPPGAAVAGCSRQQRLAAVPPAVGAAARQQWADAIAPRWAPSTRRSYEQALRLFRVVALGWDDSSFRAAPGASNCSGGVVLAVSGQVLSNAMVFPDPDDPALRGLRPAVVIAFEGVKRFLLACRSSQLNFNTLNHLRSALVMYSKLWVEPPPRTSALLVRASWIDWAQSRDFMDRVEAYRIEARLARWGMGPTNAPLVPQYVAHLVEPCAYRAAGSSAIAWPAEKTPAVVALAEGPPPALRPFNQLHWEMISWGVVSMAVFGAGLFWELRILSDLRRTKTGEPGVPQWVPLPALLFGLPFIDLLHRGGGALLRVAGIARRPLPSRRETRACFVCTPSLERRSRAPPVSESHYALRGRAPQASRRKGGALAASCEHPKAWLRPVLTARFLFWLIARSLVRWHGERAWVERLKRHNNVAAFLGEYAAELHGKAVFPCWERSVCRAAVAELVRPCRWALREQASGREYGYAVHGGRAAMASVLMCAYDTPAPTVAAMGRWRGRAAGGYVRPRHPAVAEAVSRAAGARRAGVAPHCLPADPALGWATYRPAFDAQQEPRWPTAETAASRALDAAASGRCWRDPNTSRREVALGERQDELRDAKSESSSNGSVSGTDDRPSSRASVAPRRVAREGVRGRVPALRANVVAPLHRAAEDSVAAASLLKPAARGPRPRGGRAPSADSASAGGDMMGVLAPPPHKRARDGSCGAPRRAAGRGDAECGGLREHRPHAVQRRRRGGRLQAVLVTCSAILCFRPPLFHECNPCFFDGCDLGE